MTPQDEAAVKIEGFIMVEKRHRNIVRTLFQVRLFETFLRSSTGGLQPSMSPQHFCKRSYNLWFENSLYIWNVTSTVESSAESSFLLDISSSICISICWKDVMFIISTAAHWMQNDRIDFQIKNYILKEYVTMGVIDIYRNILIFYIYVGRKTSSFPYMLVKQQHILIQYMSPGLL